MGAVIDWLNTNSGAIVAAATVVLTVLTAVYVGATYRMMSFMREQTSLQRAQVDTQLEHARDERAREDAATQIRLVVSRIDQGAPGNVTLRIVNNGGAAQGVKLTPSGFTCAPLSVDYWPTGGAALAFGIQGLSDDRSTPLRVDVAYTDTRSRSRVTAYRVRLDGSTRLEEIRPDVPPVGDNC